MIQPYRTILNVPMVAPWWSRPALDFCSRPGPRLSPGPSQQLLLLSRTAVHPEVPGQWPPRPCVGGTSTRLAGDKDLHPPEWMKIFKYAPPRWGNPECRPPCSNCPPLLTPLQGLRSYALLVVSSDCLCTEEDCYMPVPRQDRGPGIPNSFVSRGSET